MGDPVRSRDPAHTFLPFVWDPNVPWVIYPRDTLEFLNVLATAEVTYE